MHRPTMRRSVPLLTLFLAACATRPEPVAEQPAPVTRPTPARPNANLVGLTAQELVGHFGHPALQIREGTSVKLQFHNEVCVLDAYLYPSGTGSGALRVTHVDTRAPSGADYSQAACVFSLRNAR